MPGDTRYSEEIEGARGNYDWPVRFDVTDGYIGITQTHEPEAPHEQRTIERVLLSPKQVEALLDFLPPRAVMYATRVQLPKAAR